MFQKCFDILATSLNMLYKYFDDPTKLLSDLYLAKFLDALAKSSFSYKKQCNDKITILSLLSLRVTKSCYLNIRKSIQIIKKQSVLQRRASRFFL